jgi:hypothetical protein
MIITLSTSQDNVQKTLNLYIQLYDKIFSNDDIEEKWQRLLNYLNSENKKAL